ncbi:MAG: hypothetical protein Q4E51_08230 [Lachnospiraceae bacterium]|nr:hypothetical protein [Lachnospiraceae bacterium]
MDLNGVSSYSQIDAYSAYQKDAANTAPAAAKSDDTAVVYEKSEAATKYKPNAELVQMLKDDAEAQKNQFLSYVQETIMGQGNAVASSDDVWKFLASGNFTVTEAAKKQAQEAIAEGGYWSVDKTAERILDMAKALTGGDPDKIDKMREAFEKGFGEATKTWGKELPSISSDTYDKVQELFDKWKEEVNKPATETTV